MEFNIKLHLLNLKIFSDFERSPFNRFNRFIGYIEAGNNFSSLYEQQEQDEKEEEFYNEDPWFDYEPTDEELKEVKQQPDRDFLEEYTEYIDLTLEKHLSFFPGIPNVFDLMKLNEEIFQKYPGIKEFVQADQALISRYADLIKHDGPEEFFQILALEDSIEPKKDSDASVEEKGCYPAYFVDCKAYEFFKRLQENITKNPLAAYSCIYWRMQGDKLLHHHVGKKNFSTFLANHFDTEPMTLHHEERAKKADFQESYNLIEEIVYKSG